MNKSERSNFGSRTGGAKSEHGFSLLELMVSMVLFMIVTAAVWGVLRAAQMSRSVVNQQTQLAKNVRVGLNLIGRDTYNAGYGYPLNSTVLLPDNRISVLLGVPPDTDTTRDTIPPILAGNNVNANTFNTTANTTTDQVTFLFKDPTFNLVGTGDSAVSQSLNINAATTSTGGIDEVIPISGSNAGCRVNDLFLVTGNTGAVLGVVTALSGTNTLQFSNGDRLGLNLAGTSGPLRSITIPASLTRVQMLTYFVTSDGTLTRREYGNNSLNVAYTDEPLVYGVENFQIRYIMDDGTISDNPSAGPDGIAGTADDTQALLAAIRQIRFTISVRSNDLNSAGQPYRETMTATFSTRNLGYDAS